MSSMKGMKKRIYILLVLSLTTSIFTANAQQDLLLSQEIFSRVNKNPAATGNSNDIDIFLHGRLQWTGMDKGPKTTVLNVTNYVEKIKSGFGLSFSYDCFGVAHSSTNAKLAYSFQMDLSERYILSLGLGAGVYAGKIDYTKHKLEDMSEFNDGEYIMDKETRLSPDFDFGFELSNPLWTLGVSMTHLLNSESTSFKSGRHLYAYWTSLLPLGDNFSLGPTVSYMHHDQANLMEVGSLVFFKNLYWGGVTWRPDLHDKMNPSVLVFTLGFEKSRFRFGYSFDMSVGSDNLLPPSHEIILSYGIAKKSKH